MYYNRIPLNKSVTIVNENALRIDWETILPKSKLSYILGNPPFVGHQLRAPSLVEDMNLVFRDEISYGKLDYVCCWLNKAAQFINNTQIQIAFLSTNSIVQGESVSILFKQLFDMGVEITFAYKSFKWNNDGRGKAVVFCVIVGIAVKGLVESKTIYDNSDIKIVNHINGYLIDADDVFIHSRGKPITAGLPPITKGSQPTDGGNLIFSPSEKNELIKAYPQTKKLFRPFTSADDYLYGKIRYCLWLPGIDPSEYRNIPPIMERLKKVTTIPKKKKAKLNQ